MIYDYLDQALSNLHNFDIDRHYANKLKQIAWARNILTRDDWVVLDTETTGLDKDAEAIEIAVVNHQGKTIFDSLVRPVGYVSPKARAIHKISNEQLESAPTFPEVFSRLKPLLEGKTVLIYNSSFDRRILNYQCKLHKSCSYLFEANDCVMEHYAKYFGDWSDYHGDYRWQKLPFGSHRALGDAQACFQLINSIANTYVGKPKEKEILFPPIQIRAKLETFLRIGFSNESSMHRISIPRFFIKTQLEEVPLTPENFKKKVLGYKEEIGNYTDKKLDWIPF